MPRSGAKKEPSPPLSVQFGQRLRAVRETTGVSQERLAHICGLDRTYVGTLERGKKNPSLVIVFRLAAGLGVDVTELVRGLVLDEQHTTSA